MSLSSKQQDFAHCVALLILHAEQLGYRVTFGDAYATDGHKENSCHYVRLAVDLNLFDSDGTYLTETEDHRELGEYWETLDNRAKWGGRFNDGNHYSFEHNGSW